MSRPCHVFGGTVRRRGRSPRPGTSIGRLNPMRMTRTLALGASLLVLLSACGTGGGKPTIKIGSDGFYEAQLVAEMYAQVLEKAGYTVERNLGLGARAVTSPALESGQIDLTPG